MKLILEYTPSAADAAEVNPKGIKTLLSHSSLMVILFLVMDQVVYQKFS